MTQTLTRKQFMQTVAGATAVTAAACSGTEAGAARKGVFQGKPKRGVSVFSYPGELGVSMTLEDCFADMYDMGAEGVEILANGHIPGYSNPTEDWIENGFALLDRYELFPPNMDTGSTRGCTPDVS